MHMKSDVNDTFFKKWQPYKKRMQRGLSLIEAAMVLALSAVVVAGVIAYYQSASDNQRTEATISMLTDLISVVHNTYSSQANYAGINTKLIAETGALPASMIKNSEIYSPGGSKVDIEQGKYGDTSATNYFVIHFGVSNNMCPIMARLDLGSSLSGLRIGSSTAQNYTTPLNVSDSETVCKNADRGKGSQDQVTLYYEFH
ncbi:type 4 pilus major pilin [Yokenella regensburgei]|uniref:type 4 pilus major pilin n=1 Tax=Yokenella regensburgei TaxID=158877 RepID=UPI001433365B|nr:type 4 pilus major pilin [Yokenella regensburgei]QIU90101.1 hypothetical protein HEC60_12675 [Yokenella regensburgei]